MPDTSSVSGKALDKLEQIKGNDGAMRNILAGFIFIAYVAMIYFICLFIEMITFQLSTLNFFQVIFSALRDIAEARWAVAGLTLLLIIGEAAIFTIFHGMGFTVKIPDFEYADNGNYGTSRMASSKEYQNYLELAESPVEIDGIIMGVDPDTGKVVAIPKNHPHNRNFFICGSQGTAKSIAFSRTMVMQCAVRGESVFLTDPKGELYRDLALFLKNMGYGVYQWNLVNRWSSDGWDILKEVHGDERFEYVDILVDTIIANTGGKDSGDFFDNIESVLLKALCLYVLAKYPENQQNFGNVYNLIVNKSSEELDTMFAALEKETDYASKLAYGAYNLFAKSPANKGNAILGLGSRLAVFSTEVVQRMLSSSDIQVEDLGKKKTAIFCIASDSNGTYAVLNALLTSITFIKVMACADRMGGKCTVPVYFILDEFVNIGALPDFTKKLATARSRDIGMVIIVQNIPQLENRYPNGQAEEIIGGCDFRILLGANDDETSKYFSNLLGTTTIKVNTDRRSVTSSLFSMKAVSEVEGSNEGSGQRSLMLSDEIRRMPTDEMLLFVRGEQPIKLKKFQYFKDPDALLLRAYNPADVIPNWAVKDGIYLRTGEPIQETRFQMEKRIMQDPAYLVVQDSKKWGNQRTNLIRTYQKLRGKYKNAECFPNRMPFSAFEGVVTAATAEPQPEKNRTEQTASAKSRSPLSFGYDYTDAETKSKENVECVASTDAAEHWKTEAMFQTPPTETKSYSPTEQAKSNPSFINTGSENTSGDNGTKEEALMNEAIPESTPEIKQAFSAAADLDDAVEEPPEPEDEDDDEIDPSVFFN